MLQQHKVGRKVIKESQKTTTVHNQEDCMIVGALGGSEELQNSGGKVAQMKHNQFSLVLGSMTCRWRDRTFAATHAHETDLIDHS